MNRELFEALMDNIVSALIERGYNPYAQIKGALLEDEPNYITGHNKNIHHFGSPDGSGLYGSLG